MRGLTGKVAIVTGAGSGIGAAVALRMAQEGARVVLVDLDPERAHAVAATLGTDSAVVGADVAARADVDDYMRAALERFGRIDLLHLNAGIPGPFGPLRAITDEQFDAVIAVNLRGAFLGLRSALDHFHDNASAGSIVLTSSLAGLHGTDGLAAYAASKHAVIGLMRAAAAEAAAGGVRVNAIAPGLIDTPMQEPLQAALGGGSEAERRLKRAIPLGRLGTAAEVAALVAFLLSDEAAFVTGGVFVIDGGIEVADPVRIASAPPNGT